MFILFFLHRIHYFIHKSISDNLLASQDFLDKASQEGGRIYMYSPDILKKKWNVHEYADKWALDILAQSKDPLKDASIISKITIWTNRDFDIRKTLYKHPHEKFRQVWEGERLLLYQNLKTHDTLFDETMQFVMDNIVADPQEDAINMTPVMASIKGIFEHIHASLFSENPISLDIAHKNYIFDALDGVRPYTVTQNNINRMAEKMNDKKFIFGVIDKLSVKIIKEDDLQDMKNLLKATKVDVLSLIESIEKLKETKSQGTGDTPRQKNGYKP